MKEKFYPLRDVVPNSDRKLLGNMQASDNYNPKQAGKYIVGKLRKTCRGKYEYRPPQAGEWYASGSPHGGWRAPNDLSASYFILDLTVVQVISNTVTVEEGGETAVTLRRLIQQIQKEAEQDLDATYNKLWSLLWDGKNHVKADIGVRHLFELAGIDPYEQPRRKDLRNYPDEPL